MHKLGSLVFCVLSVLHLAHGQFSSILGGSGDSSSSYPRIKLAGPLGQLIGGQGISLNSGLGQVLSSIINTAASGGSSSSSGNPLQQLATAASTNYINAIRALPFGQFAGGSQQQNQHQHQHSHSQYGAPGGHGLYSGMNFLAPDSSMYGSQPNFDSANHGGHFGPNAFQHFPAENYFGNQFGGYNHGPSSSPLGSSALYGNGGAYNGHVSGHHMDK